MLIAALLLLGCWVYCVLAVVGAVRHVRSRRPFSLLKPVAISVLKPLAGLDEGLEENLRSFFEQDYREFELLFAVRQRSDPAAGVAAGLMLEYPHVRSRLFVTGEPPYAHAKVHSLQCMLDQSRYGLIVMSDSDVRVRPDFCRSLASEFEDERLGLVTCPYRAIAGKGIWSRLEAIGMNTDFHAGLFTAVMMEGAKFAVGPTIVARKRVLEDLGGIERVRDYLSSEDFMLGPNCRRAWLRRSNLAVRCGASHRKRGHAQRTSLTGCAGPEPAVDRGLGATSDSSLPIPCRLERACVSFGRATGRCWPLQACSEPRQLGPFRNAF